MGMIAWPCHAETPEILVKNEVRKLTPKSPPMLPKMPAKSRSTNAARLIFGPPGSLRRQTGDSRQQTHDHEAVGASIAETAPEKESCSACSRERLRTPERALRPCRGRRPPDGIIRLPLHPDTGSRLDQRIDCPAWQPPERSATATRMGNRGWKCGWSISLCR